VVVFSHVNGARIEEIRQMAICIARLRVLSIWRLRLEEDRGEEAWFMELEV
jgi:hypothetical protein